jgi:hypothetical protein
MEKLFLTGIHKKMETKKLHLFLPSVKQPVSLPNSEPAKSIEKTRRSVACEDKLAIGKLTTEAVHQRKGYWYPDTTINVEPGPLNFILGKHPFPLCQGPFVMPLDNDAAWDFEHKVKLSNKVAFENRTMFLHANEQECFEWVPTRTGNNAWNPDSNQDHIYDLQVTVHSVQGPASKMNMGIVYTCNKSTCVVHCPCTLCNDNKPCKLFC